MKARAREEGSAVSRAAGAQDRALLLACAMLALGVMGCESAVAKRCRESGGVMVGPAGMGARACATRSADAGRRCSDLSECEGDCVVDATVTQGAEVVGTCSELTSSLGKCVNFVERGKAQGVMCLE